MDPGIKLMGIASTALVAGAAGGLLAQGHLPGTPKHQAEGTIAGGVGLAGLMLVTGFRWEDAPGPFRVRHVVDGAEQISRRTVSLHWGAKSAVAASVLGGLGLGAMCAGLGGLLGAEAARQAAVEPA